MHLIGRIPEEAIPSKSKFGRVSHGLPPSSVSLYRLRDASTDKNLPLSDKPFPHAVAT